MKTCGPRLPSSACHGFRRAHAVAFAVHDDGNSGHVACNNPLLFQWFTVTTSDAHDMVCAFHFDLV